MSNIINYLFENVNRENAEEEIIDAEIEEITTTDAGGEYSTPYAFSDKSKNSHQSAMGKRMADKVGYKTYDEESEKKIQIYYEKFENELNETTYQELKLDDGNSNKVKIDIEISKINSQLYEIQKTMNRLTKFKKEFDIVSGDFRKNTKNSINNILNRLTIITNEVREFSK